MDELQLERHLNELREQPFSKQLFTEAYLMLDAELKRLGAVLSLMKHKELMPDSEAYQQEILESATHNLTLIKEFLREKGRE